MTTPTKTNLPLSQPVQNKIDIKPFSQMLSQTTDFGINEKNMLQEIVAEMWVDALFLHDRDAFLSDWALSSRWGEEDTTDGDELVERGKACGHVWDVARMGIREIREVAGLTQAMLSKRLAIPLSTIQVWEEREDCPDYVKFMVALLTGVIKIVD